MQQTCWWLPLKSVARSIELPDSEQSIGEQLVARILAGDALAESELVTQYGRGILFLLQRQVRTRDVADDLYQETFRIAIERIRKGAVREPAKLNSFMQSIARNVAIDFYRREGKREDTVETAVLERHALPSSNPLERLLTAETQRWVRDAIDNLSNSRDRAILFRFYIAQHSKSRICEELSLSSIHFNRVLYRAKQRFREYLQNQKNSAL